MRTKKLGMAPTPGLIASRDREIPGSDSIGGFSENVLLSTTTTSLQEMGRLKPKRKTKT